MNKYFYIFSILLLFKCSEPRNNQFNCNDVSSMTLIPLISYKFEKLNSYVDEAINTDSLNYYNELFEKFNYSLVNMAGGASTGNKIGIARPCDKLNLSEIEIENVKNNYENYLKYLHSKKLIGHESFNSLNSLMQMYFCYHGCSFSNVTMKNITVGDFLIENLILQLNILDSTLIYNDHNNQHEHIDN